DLAGHTLGLIGFGHIGRRVAVRAQAFDMSVLAFDPYVDRSMIDAAGCRSVNLPDLLASADVLSLHARATEENRGLIGRDEIARMKPGAYLVNTARDV